MPERNDTDNTVDILLVDDREDGLIALEALLHNQENYKLVKARSGQEALSLIGRYDFAMILLDVQMPVLDGFQTAELIRRQPRFQSIPIIFVTAINKDERYVYRGYESGAVDYIFKPFDPMILRSKVAVFADLHLKNRKLRLQSVQLAEREAIAQRAQVQTMELESLRRYRNLADAIPHIVLRSLGPDAMEYQNSLWAEYTGLTNSESVGAAWQQAVHPADLSALLKSWQSAIADRKKFDAEIRLRRRDNTYCWHWFKAVPEFDAQGSITWLATCTDIHVRKSAEQSLKEARQTADKANEAKTSFLANMSHEVRTPLNAIMGYSELLLDPNYSEQEKAKGASVIHRNGQQLLRIVNEILDISKVEAGGLEIEHVETSLVEMLNEIRILMLAQGQKKNLDLIFEIEPSVPKTVVTDSTRLRQILLNVIGNAIKFTEQGYVRVCTKLVERNGERHLSTEVEDTGLGIDSGNEAKIFEPFSQADSSTTRLYGGTGLGLALSRRLARALGGDVQLLRSQLGAGSRFAIEIQVDMPEEKKAASSRREEGEGDIIVLSTPVTELKGKRILLVEDSEDNQDLIKSYLSRTGIEVDLASNGRDGVQKALANEYEAVLMDIQMPLMDGYQATARLRQAGYERPIIALTAYALEDEREKCLRQGCNDHLTKPINRRRLIESLRKVVRNSSAEHTL